MDKNSVKKLSNTQLYGIVKNPVYYHWVKLLAKNELLRRSNNYNLAA